MFSRTRKKRKKVNINKQIIFLIIVFIAIIILCLLINLIYTKHKAKTNFESDLLSSNDYSDTFSIDKIILYSSANATSNETTRNLWNINVYQFTDIAIYLNNNSSSSLSSKNTIKELYIDNIEYSPSPEKGTPELYYKAIDNFGIPSLKDENLVQDKLNFKIINSKDTLDTNTANFYETCQTPITLQFVNKDIKANAIIPNSGEALVFDGSLLSKTNIALNNIKTSISFNIHLTNNLDEKYVYNVSFDIPLEDDEHSIYEGNIKKEITEFSNNKFLKLRGE